MKEEQNCGDKIHATSIIKSRKHSKNVKNCTFKYINKGQREISVNIINVIKRQKFWSSPHLNLGDEDLHLARIVLTQGEAGILEHDEHQLQVLGLEAVGQPGQQVVDQLGAHNPEARVSDPLSSNPMAKKAILNTDPSCFLTLPAYNIKLFDKYTNFPSKKVILF